MLWSFVAIFWFDGCGKSQRLIKFTVRRRMSAIKNKAKKLNRALWQGKCCSQV